jgi:toxin ParE1/3/4
VLRLDIKAVARAELRSIYDFSVAEFGTLVAEAYLTGLRQAFDRILEFPRIGSVFPDVVPEVRVFSYRSHRIFYQIDRDMVLVVRVLHSRRDAVAVFG